MISVDATKSQTTLAFYVAGTINGTVYKGQGTHTCNHGLGCLEQTSRIACSVHPDMCIWEYVLKDASTNMTTGAERAKMSVCICEHVCPPSHR